MVDLLTVGPKFTRPACHMQRTMRIARRCTALLLPWDRQTDRRTDSAPFSTLAAYVKGSPYSITERRVPELIPVLGSQPARDVSHKPGDRLPIRSARPAVTLATLKRAATNFAAW